MFYSPGNKRESGGLVLQLGQSPLHHEAGALDCVVLVALEIGRHHPTLGVVVAVGVIGMGEEFTTPITILAGPLAGLIDKPVVGEGRGVRAET